MVAGRRTQMFLPNESSAFSPNLAQNQDQGVNYRNLRKNHLGGVIFGCKNSTIKECLFKQLFGLPAQHFSYVKNIEPGLPLFLFNYSDRKLHGIFQAASSGQMNLNPYAWTTDGSERTVFPAQVQIRLGLRCHPLAEEQFKLIISDNYYTPNHFWFELDHAQVSKLSSLLSSMAIIPTPSNFGPQNSIKWRALFQAPPLHDRVKEIEKPFEAFEVGWLPLDGATLDANNHALEDSFEKQVEKPEDLIYMKLKELVCNRERSDPPLADIQDSAVVNDLHSGQGLSDARRNSEGISQQSFISSSEYPSVIAQLVQGIEELKVFKGEQIHKMCCLEQKLVEAEIEIKQLKQRCAVMESRLHPSVAHVDEMAVEPFNDLDLDLDELIFLVGGYDGGSWLSALDSYSPSHDAMKSLKPMNCIRSYSSVARLNGELYVFGGGTGSSWYDTVESYDPASDQWTLRPSLNARKGILGGATLDNKIFAIGGGNGVESFAAVEMLDLHVGRWICTRSMLHKRSGLAVAELNGALYAVGGYDGEDYLESAERFDPREQHSWTKIASMNTRRGFHSMAVLNEKLYAIGGYGGSEMVPSIEIFDPRLGSWMIGEPMDQPRGYSCAAVLKDSLYVIGGVKPGDGNKSETIIDVVERYKDGQGWEVTNLRAIGRRSFFSAIVLGS